MSTRLPHWQVMERFDPGLLDKIEPWREQLLTEGVLPLRYKELIMTAMCGVVRFLPGFEIHAQRARDNGATDQELFETCALTLLIGGVPAYRESVLTLERMLHGSPAAGPEGDGHDPQ
jgi:alkylhydroperoxidase/carboxymuconolactone decarboxylase family protein YurZ